MDTVLVVVDQYWGSLLAALPLHIDQGRDLDHSLERDDVVEWRYIDHSIQGECDETPVAEGCCQKAMDVFVLDVVVAMEKLLQALVAEDCSEQAMGVSVVILVMENQRGA